MWKCKFWIAIAKMYNRLADATSGVTKFFLERSKHGIKKYDEYYVKYIESNKEIRNILNKKYRCDLADLID